MRARGVARGVVGLLALWVFLHQEREALDPGEVVPRLGSPSEQLQHARELKQARRGRPPAVRERWTRRAVAAYRAVRSHHPRATRLGAEAAFRAAELLCASGDLEGGADELRIAIELGAGTPFRARGRLFLGRLRRRAGDLGGALAAFQSVVADPDSDAGYRDEAWLWIGRVRLETGRVDDARQAWERVVEHAQDPLDRVRAYDFVGLSWLAAGDLEAAAGVLDECLRELSERALERTHTGERVRLGLARMRLVRRLPEEIGARLRSSRSKGTPRKH